MFSSKLFNCVNSLLKLAPNRFVPRPQNYSICFDKNCINPKCPRDEALTVKCKSGVDPQNIQCCPESKSEGISSPNRSSTQDLKQNETAPSSKSLNLSVDLSSNSKVASSTDSSTKGIVQLFEAKVKENSACKTCNGTSECSCRKAPQHMISIKGLAKRPQRQQASHTLSTKKSQRMVGLKQKSNRCGKASCPNCVRQQKRAITTICFKNPKNTRLCSKLFSCKAGKKKSSSGCKKKSSACKKPSKCKKPLKLKKSSKCKKPSKPAKCKKPSKCKKPKKSHPQPSITITNVKSEPGLLYIEIRVKDSSKEKTCSTVSKPAKCPKASSSKCSKSSSKKKSCPPAKCPKASSSKCSKSKPKKKRSSKSKIKKCSKKSSSKLSKKKSVSKRSKSSSKSRKRSSKSKDCAKSGSKVSPCKSKRRSKPKKKSSASRKTKSSKCKKGASSKLRKPSKKSSKLKKASGKGRAKKCKTGSEKKYKMEVFDTKYYGKVYPRCTKSKKAGKGSRSKSKKRATKKSVKAKKTKTSIPCGCNSNKDQKDGACKKSKSRNLTTMAKVPKFKFQRRGIKTLTTSRSLSYSGVNQRRKSQALVLKSASENGSSRKRNAHDLSASTFVLPKATSNIRFEGSKCGGCGSAPPGEPEKDLLCELSNVFRDVTKCEAEKIEEYYGDTYKNKEYFMYGKDTYADMFVNMKCDRLPQPSNMSKNKCR